MNSTASKPEFADTTEEEILLVLLGCDDDKAIVGELLRLLTVWSEVCEDYIVRLGHVPECVLNITPLTAIESVALSIIRGALLNASSLQHERNCPICNSKVE